jgi:hypothetical protein
MIKLLTLMTQMFTASAAVLVFMADEYMVMGFGLNPWVALPLATLFMVAPYFVDRWFVEQIDPDDGLSVMRINKKAFDNPSGRFKRYTPDTTSTTPDEHNDEISTTKDHPDHPQTIDDYKCNDRDDPRHKIPAEHRLKANREAQRPLTRLEKEHFGDPDLKTGIYHPDNQQRRNNTAPLEKMVNPNMPTSRLKQLELCPDCLETLEYCLCKAF